MAGGPLKQAENEKAIYAINKKSLSFLFFAYSIKRATRPSDTEWRARAEGKTVTQKTISGRQSHPRYRLRFLVEYCCFQWKGFPCRSKVEGKRLRVVDFRSISDGDGEGIPPEESG